MKSLVLLSATILVLAISGAAQTTYDQTSAACHINNCTNAPLSGTSATLSYSDNVQYTNVPSPSVVGSLTYAGNSYNFYGHYFYVRQYVAGYGLWELTGTTTDGSITFIEYFKVGGWRGGGWATNLGGSLTVY
ncbi:MAG TPA: hypothetical protein VG498_06655 [Terriglobales bacterium]|nr:hypothetical protein [Terriglobales bacterium]